MGKYTSAMLRLLLLMFLDTKEVLGIVDMTCSPTDTAFGEASTCTCTTDSGTGITWQKDGIDLMLCYNGGVCDVTLSDYLTSYSTSGSDKLFTLTIKAFQYSHCAVFTCKDQDTAETDQETLTLHEFNGGTPSVKSEPGAGKNGTIEITTDCLFKENDIVVDWYAIDGSSSEKFTPDGSFKTATTCSDASKVCSAVNAVTLNIGFTHTEKSSKCAQIKVEVYNSVNSSIKLDWTTTDKYCIEEGTTVPPTSSTTVPPTAPTTPPPTSSTTTKSPDIPVVIIVPCVVVVILIICIIVCILLRKKSNRKKKYRADPENVQMPQVDKNVTK